MSLISWLSTAIVVGSMLGACASPPAAHSAYNAGVAAYRTKDYATARTEWQEAASTGDASAKNNLGYLLSEGLGGERDQAAAVRLWTEAAKQGHSEAALHLGGAFKDGNGVPKSDIEAFAWYSCAVASARAASASDGTEHEILGDANDALSRLIAAFPPEDFGAAQRLAELYERQYVPK
jgi:TPR repeat protein